MSARTWIQKKRHKLWIGLRLSVGNSVWKWPLGQRNFKPEDVRWWRLRALLLVSNNLYGSQNEPRDPDWLNILEQCKSHDPDNALYDYLAAWQFWDVGVQS